MKNMLLNSLLLLVGLVHPCFIKPKDIKALGVPGLRGNTKKIPKQIESLGFTKDEYAVVRFSDIDEHGQWHQRKSYIGQLGDVQTLEQEIAKYSGPFNLIAASRGAATAINWDGLGKNDGRVVTIVAEACFLHVEDVLSDRIRLFKALPQKMQHFIIRYPLPITHKGFPLYDPAGLQPHVSILRGTTPLLLLASEDDYVVPGSHTPGLYKLARNAARSNVYMFIVPGRKHTGHLCDKEVQKVVHAFWAHYGAPHNPALAAQGAALFATTQPDF